MGEGPFPQRPHLENSRPIRWACLAADEAAEDAVNHLLGLLEDGEKRVRARRPADRERLRATLEAITLDLYLSAKQDPQQFLAYSRRKADYGETGEHRGASLTTVVQVVEFLEGAGYATARLGSFSRRANPFGGPDVGVGYRSRVRAEPALVDLLEGVFGVSPDSIAASALIVGRPIRMKAAAAARGATKRYLRFRPTQATEAMALRVVAANRLRAECDLAFDGPRPAGIHLRNTDLHRTFNNGRWDHGGRFYGGWWQGLSKADRARILIDGETTVELDFRAFQPRLCFHLEGQPVPLETDPYAIPGFDPAVYREAIKKAFGQLLNATPLANIRRSGPAKALFPDGSYPTFVMRVERALEPIRGWLRAGRGLELQFIDSEVADGIIAALTAERIPCLPIHDSFIVPRSTEGTVGRIMCEVYRDQLLRRTGVAGYPAIAGWSSMQVEQSVRSALPAL